jgi:hypothetical protein
MNGTHIKHLALSGCHIYNQNNIIIRSKNPPSLAAPTQLTATLVLSFRFGRTIAAGRGGRIGLQTGGLNGLTTGSADA